jgi:hypothetical protein
VPVHGHICRLAALRFDLFPGVSKSRLDDEHNRSAASHDPPIIAKRERNVTRARLLFPAPGASFLSPLLLLCLLRCLYNCMLRGYNLSRVFFKNNNNNLSRAAYFHGIISWALLHVHVPKRGMVFIYAQSKSIPEI